MVSNKPANPEAVPAPIDWPAVTNLNDALALFGNVVQATDVFGDGVEFIKDKSVLIGRPFLILQWHWNEEQKFVTVHVMGENGSQARFNDGGTGVYKSLRDAEERGLTGGIMVPYGLRVSRYTHPEFGESETYYFNA